MDEVESFRIMSGSGLIQSMRSTGYRTTAHALGELIDNSIQAGATKITIVVETASEKRQIRSRESIQRISVIDNGCGMDPTLLRKALMMGEGTNFGKKNSLGKFGVGLPQASLSQATIIEAWSWQNSADPLHTGFDIGDKDWCDRGGNIPEPTKKQVPEALLEYVDTSSPSGTIIRWSNLDRLSHNSSTALFKNAEMLIGRMYRYWINDNRVSIEYVSIDTSSGKRVDQKTIRAVDPLYLMSNTSVSSLDPPVDPMFELVSDSPFSFEYEGKKLSVRIRTTVARPEIKKLVNKSDAYGSSPVGKHAAANVGVSIVREGRELELISDWASAPSNTKDPRNRWWGCEVSFSSECDELFGVTNDKQSANNLREYRNTRFNDYKEDGEKPDALRDRLKEEDPRLFALLSVVDEVTWRLKDAYNKSPAEKKTNDEQQGPRRKAEEVATQKTDELEKKGVEIGLDNPDSIKTYEEKQNEIYEICLDSGMDETEARTVSKDAVDAGNRFYFIEANEIGEDSFFIPKYCPGNMTLIKINTSNKATRRLFELLSYVDGHKKLPSDELEALVIDTYDFIKTMLLSWARMEEIAIRGNDSEPGDVRRKWGRKLRDFDDSDD